MSTLALYLAVTLLLLPSRSALDIDFKVSALPEIQKSATADNAEAQYQMGICYDQGYGVRKDFAQAVKWYTRAAEQGHADAQCALGLCHANGKGVSSDLVKAYMWLSLSAAGNVQVGAEHCKRLEKKMNASQVTEAKQLVKAFVPK
ncbi:TPA: hypothetical protein DDW35_06230 [Candidatus Sumerlaeota bacterium]|jgi:TPR repeat protein|nr:hypothetical protein [Candidatus Sumerlaeota bacterium]